MIFTKVTKIFKVEAFVYVIAISGYAISHYLKENSATLDENESTSKRSLIFRLNEIFELLDKQICSHPNKPFNERIPINLPGESGVLAEYYESLELVIAKASDQQINFCLTTMQQMLTKLQDKLAVEQDFALSKN